MRKILLICSLLLFAGCQPAQNGGMELSPAGEVAVSVASLYIPEPWRTIVWVLLGSAVSGGVGGVVGRKTGKKK
ncbi:hypothetical protein LCGC14_0358370 [marine sediment metagenome]|uniref:Uncharacterized protein n=1 Tax=marine sediment metagenome TaxID=412755 RepID=A0A0F9TRI6_9ZZZZ|nr:hypothetical protein [Pricia sp.]